MSVAWKFPAYVIIVCGLLCVSACYDLTSDKSILDVKNLNVRKYALITRHFYVNVGLDLYSARLIGNYFISLVPAGRRDLATNDEVRNLFACTITGGRAVKLVEEAATLHEFSEIMLFMYGSDKGAAAGVDATKYNKKYKEYYDENLWPRMEALIEAIAFKGCTAQYMSVDFTELVAPASLP